MLYRNETISIHIMSHLRIATVVAFCLSSFLTPSSHADNPLFERHTAFRAGEDGYHTYRLPVMVATNKDTLILFCDGRKDHAGDLGTTIEPVVRRSTDGGMTWESMQVLHHAPKGEQAKIGNGTAVFDAKTKKVHFVYCYDLKRAYIVTSDDDGKAFSKPREITETFREFPRPWEYFATGHVHGIQTQSGRLVLPIWLSNVPRHTEGKLKDRRVFQVGTIYSDDGGRTFHAGGLVPTDEFRGLNESVLYEASDGSLRFNHRGCGKGARALSRSDDGGVTWSKPRLDEQLPCPTCQATALTVAGKDGQHRVFFFNPASKKARERMTVRMSLDDGRTWPVKRVVDAGKGGYSDMASDSEGDLYAAYESGNKRYADHIALVKFNVAWLMAEVNQE